MQSQLPAFVTCVACPKQVSRHATSCDSCGRPQLRFVEPLKTDAAALHLKHVPKFAMVAPKYNGVEGQNLTAEYKKLVILMARERVSIVLHWLVFALISLVGLIIAAKIYFEFMGDPATRLVAASGPLLWINIGAFVSISFVNKTKKEMEALREKISYVRFKIDNPYLVTGRR
jgi:hypothetical protein